MNTIYGSYSNLACAAMQPQSVFCTSTFASNPYNTSIFATNTNETQNNAKTQYDAYNDIATSYIDSIRNSYIGVAKASPRLINTKAVGLKNTVDALKNQGMKIRDTYMESQGSYCFDKIKSILSDESKTQEEKQEEINLILEKMEASKNEAAKKLEILSELMRGCSKIASLTLNIPEGQDDPTAEAMEGILDIAYSIDTDETSQIKQAKSSDDIEEINANMSENILKMDSTECRNKANDLDKQIDDWEEKLQNATTDEEKQEAKVMIASLEAQKEIFSSLSE